jgi:hypothetical protein
LIDGDCDGAHFSMGKVTRCDQYLAEFAQDEPLVRAYQSKRSKELKAAENLFSDEAMQIAYMKAAMACDLFDRKLQAGDSAWSMGNSVTMADLFWAVELPRMKNLGVGYFWYRINCRPWRSSSLRRSAWNPSARRSLYGLDHYSECGDLSLTR